MHPVTFLLNLCLYGRRAGRQGRNWRQGPECAAV